MTTVETKEMALPVLEKKPAKGLAIPLLVWLVVIGFARLTEMFQGVPWISDYSLLFTAALLLYTPVIIYWRQGKRFEFLDSGLKQYGRSFLLFLGFSLIIFSLTVLVVALLPQITYRPRPITDILAFFGTHLIMVALPEEFFFRGYLHQEFNAVFGKKWRLLGASIGPSLILVSLLFAVSHSLIRFQAWHVLIFFPSLAFGWLREKRGTITAAVLFHAACNLVSYLVWVKF